MHLLHESEFDSGHFMTRLTNHEMGIMTDLTGVWSSPVMCQMCHLRVCLTGLTSQREGDMYRRIGE